MLAAFSSVPPLSRWARQGSAWRRRAVRARENLDVRADMQRPHISDRRDALPFALGDKLAGRAAIGAPRVRVTDVVVEELPEARLRALADGADERRNMRIDEDKPVHAKNALAGSNGIFA